MRHGTTVRIAADGLHISLSRLKTIGIYDESVSWAVWLPSDDRGEPHHPDLLISAINPLSWPYTFRLTVRLKNEIGSMASAARRLKDLGVNILSARSSVSGHHHATWNLIGEAILLRDEFERKGWSFFTAPSGSSRDDIAAEMARRLLDFLDDFLQKFQKFGDPEYLHHRFIQQQLLSFAIDRIGSEVWRHQDRWARIGDQRSRAVVCSVLPVLMFLWRRGVTHLKKPGKGANGEQVLRSLPPLEFHYDRASGILRGQGERFADDLRNLDVGIPGVAVASFDTDEHYLRLLFFKEDERRKLHHIDIDYYQHFVGEQSTRGLVEFVTRCIADRGINLVQVSNSVSAQSPAEESGGLRFIVEFPEEKRSEEMDVLEAELRTELQRAFEGFTVKKLKTPPVSVGRIFLSRHEDLARTTPLEVARELAQRFGLESIVARTVVGDVTENAVRELRLCQGLVQVYGKRKAGAQEEMQWLVGEYAAAIALGLPAIRIVDLSVKTEKEWGSFLRWGRDQVIVFYDSAWGDPDIRGRLDEPLRLFLREVIATQALQRAAG